MIEFLNVDEKLKQEWIRYSKWSSKVNEEVIRIENGFSLIAKVDGEFSGIVSVYYKTLPCPLINVKEAYIDNVEVLSSFRNQGVATALINEAISRIDNSIFQVRAWSSEDKKEMINLWKKLKFTLNPVTIYPNGKEVNGFYVSKIV